MVMWWDVSSTQRKVVMLGSSYFLHLLTYDGNCELVQYRLLPINRFKF
jgi:hypothetical protein